MPSLYSDDRNRQSQGRSTTPPTASDTMRAIVQFRYGTDPSSVLELADVARPAIGDDEVLVRVAAASVDMGVVRRTPSRRGSRSWTGWDQVGSVVDTGERCVCHR